MIDLNELMKLHDKATEGTWEYNVLSYYKDYPAYVPFALIKNQEGIEVSGDCTPDDAAYIVAACNSIPDLIHRIRELEDEVESLRDALEESENRQRSPLTDEEWAWIVRNA